MEDKLAGLVAGLLKMSSSDVGDDLTMKDVESWDSLKHMELIAALEQTFEIQLTFEEIVTMRSVGKIRQVLREKGASI